jgi:hypothetical protein
MSVAIGDESGAQNTQCPTPEITELCEEQAQLINEPEPEIIADPEEAFDPPPGDSSDPEVEPPVTVPDPDAGETGPDPTEPEPVIVDPVIPEPEVTDPPDSVTDTTPELVTPEPVDPVINDGKPTGKPEKPKDDPRPSPAVSEIPARPESPAADHTHEHAEHKYSSSFSGAIMSTANVGELEHALPNVPPLTAKGKESLIEYQEQGGDPYLILALHWDEEGFSDWGSTMQTLPTNLTDRELTLYLIEREIDPVDTLRLRDLAEAFGLEALHKGLGDDEVKQELIDRTLADEGIPIYPGGREDIKAGHIDGRVLVTMHYLRKRYGVVEISSLITGHSRYTASGNISLHSLGQAFDIALLGDQRIAGNTQYPGSNTEKAVRDLVALPEGMGVSEIISLWDVGGASFAMGDHDDHIHVGYK